MIESKTKNIADVYELYPAMLDTTYLTHPCPKCGNRLKAPYKCQDCNIQVKLRTFSIGNGWSIK